MTGNEFPTEGMELTHILVVDDAVRAGDFYRDVLGAELYREYGGTSGCCGCSGTTNGRCAASSATRTATCWS